MTAEIFEDKFSMLEQLDKFVWHLAWRYDNPENVMMSADEIASELKEELVKGIKAYGDRPANELLAILKRMLDNRIAELTHRFYGTYRKEDKRLLRLDAAVSPNDEGYDRDLAEGVMVLRDNCDDPQDICESRERVQRTFDGLSPIAKQVLSAVLYENDDLDTTMKLAMLRAESRFSSPHIDIKPRHVASALGLPEKVVKNAFEEISKAYMEVING
jgi:hypothetical protein